MLHPERFRLDHGWTMERAADGAVTFTKWGHVDGQAVALDWFTIPGDRWCGGVTAVSAPHRLDTDVNRSLVRVEVERIHHGASR